MTLKVAHLKRLIAPLRAGPHGLSQNAVARECGIEPSTLSRWLKGGPASYAQVAQVAQALKVPVADLWAGPMPRRLAADPLATDSTEPERERFTPEGAEAALWACEQMNLAVARIARQVRLGLRPEATARESEARATLAARDAALAPTKKSHHR